MNEQTGKSERTEVAMRLPKSVQAVTVVGAVGAEPDLIYKRKVRKKKHSFITRKVNGLTRRLSKAEVTGIATYFGLHRRSNNKKRDGWWKDLGKNLRKSGRKVVKKL